MDGLLLIPICLPAAAGIVLLLSSFLEHLKDSGTIGKSPVVVGLEEKEFSGLRRLRVFVMATLSVSSAAALILAWTGERSVTLFTFLDNVPIYFRIDHVSRLFVTVVSVIWLICGIYSIVYMGSEGEEKRYFGFYVLLYGILVALDFSGNLVTMYLFYELMTIVSFPLVLHNGTREAIMAALKYLFYSMCGAYAGLFGIYVLHRYAGSLTFTAGGVLGTADSGHKEILLTAVFVMLIGFGAKAGMLPFHAWLPAAHPVAPSPASAVLSGIIVKSGVLAVIRMVYYVVGPNFIRGTWVQYVWMSLTLVTVFMGSLLAYREKMFKRRLAYSTVSQVSYILFGLSLLTQTGFTGALLHLTGHAVMKSGLFLTAGVFLYKFGYTRVDQLKGLGKKMPAVMWCYTIFSLGLIGIPPTVGFVSKWYLAEGSLRLGGMFGTPPMFNSDWLWLFQDIGIFSWLGPVVLLVSAFLTAGYLLPVTMRGFFPGEEVEGLDLKHEEPSPCMLFPLVILAVLTLFLGIVPGPLEYFTGEIAGAVLSP